MQFLIFLFAITAVFCQDIHKDFQKSNDLFASSLYKEILKNNKYNGKNLLISPLSAETVLALAQSGCRDETAQEIRSVLHLPNDQTKIQNLYKTVLPTLDIHSANKIYVKEKFPVLPDFKKIASEVFHADCKNIDFSKKDEAAGIINQWVEEQTNNKIRDLISPDILNDRTRLVLVNAVHFKGHWSIPFPPTATFEENFYTGKAEVRKIETMHNQIGRKYLYFECPHLNAKFLELPFENNASMTFILPNNKNGLASLEKQIDRVLISHNLTRELVEVSLPKFAIESTFEFKDILKNLGVSKAFDETEADLSGIAGNKGDLIIDSVNQKTFVKVEEGGVEAAAATSGIIPIPPSPIVEPSKHFKADHPFLFYIKINGVIGFVGRFLTPN
ncbi:alaserpin-like [Tribolium madens]|uniref:alaserpin-like n=1 Tax=Tribolium madens TaxID=41895 RepID=UPI001CF72709|nr:alaserpin-like [Tribolium madens]